MPTSKDTSPNHEVIVHGSTTIETTLHNDCKKPHQEVPHHLIGLSLLCTPITLVVAISINQSTIGGGGKTAFKWKRKRQQPLVENGPFSTSVCDYVLVASDKYD
jgi:hypothetical protein